MPSVLNLVERFNRWRHSRGFGIHSPFAFRFVTEVLCLPKEYGYYAYLDITEPDMRTLFRVATRFQPQKVAFIDCDTKAVRNAVFMAAPKAKPSAIFEADFIVFNAKKNRKLPYDAIPSTANLVILNYTRWKDYQLYRESLAAGMIFANRKSMAIAATYAYLPRQDFNVKF